MSLSHQWDWCRADTSNYLPGEEGTARLLIKQTREDAQPTLSGIVTQRSKPSVEKFSTPLVITPIQILQTYEFCWGYRNRLVKHF
jgi:hypothetical protein